MLEARLLKLQVASFRFFAEKWFLGVGAVKRLELSEFRVLIA
jgi:hypothetical protein